MVLRVSNRIPRDSVNLNEIVMSIEEFADIRNHPYISTQRFDSIVVDLEKNIPLGYLLAVSKTTRVIPRIVTECNTDVVRLLAELYPDRAAEIRYSYIRDKERLSIIIEELKKSYDWESYY